MPEADMTAQELVKMIADYMENGFLDNIIDMFLHDSSLYKLAGELIQDERIRVRLGVTAMMEELGRRDRRHAAEAIPQLLPLLEHKEPNIRGDAANLLGIIGGEEVIPFLQKAANDQHGSVRALVQEALLDISSRIGERCC